MRIPQGWLDELKESPQFIKTTLLDVKRASSIVTQKVDKIAQELEQNVTEEQEDKRSAKERIFMLRWPISKPLTTRSNWTN